MEAEVIHDARTIHIALEGKSQGLTYSEIGDLLGVTKNAVAGLMHRVRQRTGEPAVRTTQQNRARRVQIRSAVLESLSTGGSVAGVVRGLNCSKRVAAEIRDDLVAEGLLPAVQERPQPVAVEPKPAAPAPVVPLPSAFFLRVVPTVSTRPPRPERRIFWTDAEVRRLRELVLTEPSLRRIALALDRRESTVAHKLAEMRITPIYRLSFLTRGAIDRLHREGQPVRRIAIRTGIPIPLVERHLAKAGVGQIGGSSPQAVGKAAPE